MYCTAIYDKINPLEVLKFENLDQAIIYLRNNGFTFAVIESEYEVMYICRKD